MPLENGVFVYVCVCLLVGMQQLYMYILCYECNMAHLIDSISVNAVSMMLLLLNCILPNAEVDTCSGQMCHLEQLL